MENTNFIPANELPVAEGDEVSVLCVENGELKLKSAASLGGSNEVVNNYDAVVRVNYEWDSENGNMSATATFVSGSYDAVLQKLNSHAIPRCLFIEVGTTFDGWGLKSVMEVNPRWDRSPDGQEALTFEGNFFVIVQPDGTTMVE